MTPIPLHPNLPTPTTAFGNPAPIAQYYICPHCKEQSPLVREWVGLTLTDREQLRDQFEDWNYPAILVDVISDKLKEKNT